MKRERERDDDEGTRVKSKREKLSERERELNWGRGYKGKTLFIKTEDRNMPLFLRQLSRMPSWSPWGPIYISIFIWIKFCQIGK